MPVYQGRHQHPREIYINHWTEVDSFVVSIVNVGFVVFGTKLSCFYDFMVYV